MSHLRKQIRDRLSGTTLASLTTTGTRVYVGRAWPLGADASPTLLIDVGAEQVETAEILHGRQRTLNRTLEVVVRGMVKAVSGYLDSLDSIALEVETALAADQSLGGITKSVQLTAIDEPDIEGLGEKPVAVITMHFSVHYLTALNAPQTPR